MATDPPSFAGGPPQAQRDRAKLREARALRLRSRDRLESPRIRAECRQAALALFLDLPMEARAASTKLHVAQLLYEERRYLDCLAELDRIDAADASAPILILRSRALYALNRFGEALNESRRVLDLDPANAAAAFQLRAFRHFDLSGELPDDLDRESVEEEGTSPVAVAVGSGLGNLIHAGPMIRRLSMHYGVLLDVIVAEDFKEARWILHDPRYVRAVLSLGPRVLARRYDLVFVANCFGTNRIGFTADRVEWSRDWADFRAEGGLHESVFNLEAAKRLLGVSYELADAYRPLLEPSSPSARQPRLIGVHAGSKGGFWASKRWPYFEQLAAALNARGFEVAAFGLPSEAVPGADDRTGGTVAEMADAIRGCAAFIANDSGVMNLANALGIPVLALFGPTNWRTRGPLGATSLSLRLVKNCSPCECAAPRAFKEGRCMCMGDLPVEAVLRAFDVLRSLQPPQGPPTGVSRAICFESSLPVGHAPYLG